MSAGCEGYACPPEHSVPSQSVVVVRTGDEQLATTGGELGLGLIGVGLVLFVMAGITAIARRVRR